jgi:pyruvate kinase
MKNMKIPVNKAKMIATFGPAISARDVFLEIVKSGVDVIRFNFSHGEHEDHKKGFDLVKSVNKEFGLNIGILADMQGPKIRVGEVEGTVMLRPNSTIQITDKKTGFYKRALIHQL